MKKAIRCILVVVAVLCLCASLSGCSMIEEMRAAHGVKTDANTVTYNGEEYKKLPASDILMPIFSKDMKELYVTAPDVPVLLSIFYGEYCTLSDDGVYLEYIQNYEEDGVIYYCRSDKYEQALDIVQNGFEPAGYLYTYEVLEDPVEWVVRTDTYTFSAEEIRAINAVLQTAEPISVVGDLYTESEEYTEVYCYGEDAAFREYAFDLCVMNDGYYVIQYDADTETSTALKVPEEYASVFAAILQPLVESGDAWDEYYDENMDWYE